MQQSPQPTVAIILAIVAMLGVALVGFLTNILREASGEDKPFSFSRLQLFLWTLIIVPVFCLHWGYLCYPADCKLNEKFINTTALILLGISSSVTLLASLITSGQNSSIPRPLLKMDGTSRNFFTDILTDDTGQISIARLQQLIFTFIYIVIYVTDFFGNDHKYPDFDNNAFILMGISTGSYVLAKALHK